MTDWPPLRDYARSRAILLGVWDYQFLRPVPAAMNSLRRMAGVLGGPLCGWPRDRLLVLENESGPGDLPDRLITAFDEVSDIALFYFVGHGQMSSDDQLCLGLAQSRTEPNRRASTSLEFADVRQALAGSSASVKILILDCCFAGLATKPTLAGAAGDLLDMTAGTGAYTMAATGAYTTAWFEDNPVLLQPQTYFTKYLADLLEQGIPGQPSRLKLDPLFKRLQNDLAADQLPIPRSRSVDDVREFEFAHNAAPAHTHHDPEREVARLTEQLAQSQSQAKAFQAEIASLNAQLAHASTTQERRRLQDALDTAERLLEDTMADTEHGGPAAEIADDGASPRQQRIPDGGPERPQLLGGRYAPDRVVGRGGMAEVYRARDIRLDRIVAIKRLRADRARDKTFQARFRREVGSAASLNVPSQRPGSTLGPAAARRSSRVITNPDDQTAAAPSPVPAPKIYGPGGQAGLHHVQPRPA